MKRASLFFASLILLFVQCGCSSSTEVNGGLGTYNPSDNISFSTVMVGAYNTGMFISSDTCEHWHMSAQSTPPHVYCLASGAHYMYAGSYTGGLYRSSDNGDTWQHITSIGDTSVFSCYTSGSLVIAGCSLLGIAVSTDEGDTWTQRSSGSPPTTFASIGNDIFASAGGIGVLHTSDQGTSWETVNIPNAGTITAVTALDGALYATAQSQGVFRSTDQGNNWELICSSSPISYGMTANKHILYGGSTTGLMRSLDSGVTWQSIDDIPSLVYRPIARGNYVFAATYRNGVFFSNDNGNTWRQRNNGLTDTVILALGLR